MPNKRTRKLTEATAEAVAIAVEQGLSPLQHMMNVLHDSSSAPARKDTMAIAAAPYVHCKLSATATVNVPDADCRPLEIKIIALPRGAQVAADGSIVWEDGTEVPPEQTRFEPFKASPGFDELPSPEPAPAEPLLVHELDEDDDKIAVLNAHRRRQDDEPGSGAA